MIKKSILPLIVFSASTYAITFSDAISVLQKHESIQAVIGKSKAISEEAKFNGSWGDPRLKIAANNFPLETLQNDQTPMTGIEFGISHKVSLTTKYGNIKDAFKLLSKAYTYEANDKKEALTKALWEILILKRKITEELSILNENQAWISKILRVTKRLYANGKTSQQATLDIQIRKLEVENDISNKSFELLQINDKIYYLVGDPKIDENSIPWSVLKKKSSKVLDNRVLGLKEKLRAKELSLIASKLNYFPDITLSVAFTKRSNIDGVGDFVGASVSFPLPFSDEKYSKYGQAVQDKYVALKNFEDYKRSKVRDVSILKKEIKKLISEIRVLKKAIKFATNSRTITSKSYGLGISSYFELLQSELKLQKILMHKVMLKAKSDINKIALKYILGAPLHE